MAILPSRPLHADNPDDVANGSFIQVVVKGPADVNRLLIFTGTAILNIAGQRTDDFVTSEVNLEIILMEKFPFSVPKGVRQWSATYASLASQDSITRGADNDEFLFDTGVSDGDISTFLDGDQALKLRATLVTRNDCDFNRLAYQANILAHAD
jgi:hypothetical protein